MYEAIVTLVIPAKEKLVPGTGALLSRDRTEVTEPAHTRIFRYEFDTEEAMLDFFDTSEDPKGLVAVEQM